MSILIPAGQPFCRRTPSSPVPAFNGALAPRARRALAGLWLAWCAIAVPHMAVAAQEFLDDFERDDTGWTGNIGAGWLHNQATNPPFLFNKYAIVDGTLRGADHWSGWMVATNFTLGSVYALSVDIQYTNLDWSNPFGDSLNALFGNRAYGPTPPNDQDNRYLEVLFIAPYRTNPPPQAGRVLLRVPSPSVELFEAYPTGFVSNAWYRLTLQRSNSLARATLAGTNISVDSGWISMGTSAPPVDLTNSYGGLRGNTRSKGCLDNFALTTHHEPVPPQAFHAYLSTNDISLYVPFDGSPDAAIARGSATAQVHGAASFGTGRYGQGYLAGRDNPAGIGDELLYSVSGNVDSACGTVAMWVKPLNWTDADVRWRPFFAALEEPGGPAILRLYKYFNHVPLYWLAQQNYFQSTTLSVGKKVPLWTSNTWSHLAASWAGPVMRLYVNGKYVGSDSALTPNLLRNFGNWMYVGGVSETSNNAPDSVIDEFYVFNRPLTRQEISTLHQLGGGAFSNAASPGLEMETLAAYYPSTTQLQVRITLNGRRADQLAGLTSVVHVQTFTGGATPVRPVTNAVTGSDLTVGFSPVLGSGTNRAYTELMSGGQVVATSAALFEVPATNEWLGNTTGIPSGPNPPAPWPRLTTNGQSVSYWGGTAVYRDSLFPTQLCARGVDLLKRPISLSLTANGSTNTVLGNAIFGWTNVTGLAAAFCASGTLGGVSILASGRLEFDGFLWTTISIPAQGGVAIGELKLEIPMVASVAKFQQGKLYNGLLPASGRATSWNYALQGQPFLWLGNEEVGLQWCTGDSYDYENGTNQGRQVELAVGPSETLFTVRLVDRSANLVLDRPLAYTFGLQTTPVKPLPANWRSYDLSQGSGWRPATGRGVAVVPTWRLWWQGWNTQNAPSRREGALFGYPAPDPLTCQSEIARFVSDNQRPFLYWDMQAIWRGAPDYAGWRSEWGAENPPSLPFETASGVMSSNGTADRAVSSYRDWAIWRYHKSMAENAYLANIAGFYNDVAQGFWGTEPRIGSNGLVRSRHELRGVRELQKRMYVAMGDWPGKVILNHQSGDNHMSQLAFAHFYLNGEQYLADYTNGYNNVLDFDSGLVELQGRKWGIPLMFLPRLPLGATSSNLFSTPHGLAAGEHLQGLLLMHDAMSYGDNTHPLPLVRVAAMKELFGWDEQVDYIGYWKTSPAYLTKAADQSPVEVAVYRRPHLAAGQSVLFAVMNNSDTNATVTLTPNWAALGVAPAPTAMVDAITAVGIPDAPVDWGLLYASNILRFAEPRVYGPVIMVPEAPAGSYSFTVPKRNFRVLASDPRFGEDPAANGVPQRWLVRFYPGTTNWNAAALSDTDGDGAAAWEEYSADTDPTAGQSVLRITDIGSRGSNRLDICWASRTTRTYSVLMTTNLVAGWTLPPRTSNVRGHASGTNRHEEVNPPVSGAFYKILVE